MRVSLAAAAMLLAGGVLAAPNVIGKTSQPLTAKKVTVYKNGLGYFVREGKVPLKNGWATIDGAPQATLGGLWAESLDKGSRITSMVASREDVDDTAPISNIYDLLASNVSRDVVLKTEDGEFRGRIGFVTRDDSEEMRQVNSRMRLPRTSSYTSVMPRGQIVSLQLNMGEEVFLSIWDIEAVTFTTPQARNDERTVKSTKDVLKLQVEPVADSANVRMSYLRKEIGWTPSYRVDLLGDDAASIRLRATLINDAEDLKDTDVAFTVGYPNFQFSDIPSPMSLQQGLAEFLDALNRGNVAEVYGLANVTRQSVMYSGLEEAAAEYSTTPSITPTAEGDLYFYTQPGVTLKRGDRADYDVIAAQVETKHVYKWTVADQSNVDTMGNRQRSSNDQEPPKQQVWHVLRMENTSGSPWTTAPALVLKNGAPLAQDTLNYTPADGETDLKLTVASDVSASANETETTRERGINMGERIVDKITVDGALRVKNYKNEAVDLEIVKNLTGDVLEASNDGRIEKRAESVKGLNSTSTITWNLPLKAGEVVEVTYQFVVYVAN